MNLKHFKLSEFDSPDLPGSGERMDEDFLKLLDKARSIANTPFKINSGYRTPSHNSKVGGKSSSSHLKGMAADIHCNDDASRSLIVQALIEVGFTRIGIAKTFIHVDNDKAKNSNRIWVY
jgi:uncharacterized protein YcbK (DUF882 family)